jgi:alkanesulfonate monooxygenase SsuD/methylene tetrahydromethanopterin reductase-like flavin-dependent oxidoreductase (luciferase family)
LSLAIGTGKQGQDEQMTDPGSERVHLAVALDGAGWHPAAWREPDARPAELLTAAYWADAITEAERGLLDFVTIEDGLSLQSTDPRGPDDRTDQVRGRLDAVLIAARVAPLTNHVGLMPTVTVTHTEPFHLSKAIATLDWVSSGRAGIRVKVSGRQDEASHFGRRTLPSGPQLAPDLFAEAADYVEVIRRLWDSWEDDAEIRDVATGRFVDVSKLHYIDFSGPWFSVRGPSITPRPPQGQPVVAALAHRDVAYQLLATSADVGFVTPRDAAGAAQIAAEVRADESAAGRAHAPVRLFADLLVFLDDRPGRAAQRRARLDELAGAALTSDALIFAGTPGELADLMQDWQSARLTGFRLRPATIPHDLRQITRGVVGELQRRGAFPDKYESSSLRGLLGLSRPDNRYATARAGNGASA